MEVHNGYQSGVSTSKFSHDRTVGVIAFAHACPIMSIQWRCNDLGPMVAGFQIFYRGCIRLVLSTKMVQTFIRLRFSPTNQNVYKMYKTRESKRITLNHKRKTQNHEWLRIQFASLHFRYELMNFQDFDFEWEKFGQNLKTGSHKR